MEKYKVMKKKIMVDAYQTKKSIEIETLEGMMHAEPGDWIITGIKGEQYPVREDIFYETYEIIY
ncbi:hypothetical protein AB6889_02275 [Carnobacterium maltaromaticum]|uniref:hypothetical protein n=1 Tax=Carnobacterium maltaromaticum TaxID=2751 RepID=UPI0039BE420E